MDSNKDNFLSENSSAISKNLQNSKLNINEISTQALAYLGDCVIELFVREKLTLEGISSSKRLNTLALHYVSAPNQSAAMKNILNILTDEEISFFRRGRNIGHTNTPKNAKVSEYRTATGMETLFGFLHISGNIQRAKQLFDIAYKKNDKIFKNINDKI